MNVYACVLKHDADVDTVHFKAECLDEAKAFADRFCDKMGNSLEAGTGTIEEVVHDVKNNPPFQELAVEHVLDRVLCDVLEHHDLDEDYKERARQYLNDRGWDEADGALDLAVDDLIQHVLHEVKIKEAA